MPNSTDPAALLSFCINMLCKRHANAACKRSACHTHCRLLGGCAIKTHVLESMPPNSEQPDPEPEIDVDVAQPTMFLPQAGPSHPSSLEDDIDLVQLRTFMPQAGSLPTDVDLAQPMTFLPQAGPLHASSPEADVDVAQLRTFLPQAGSLPADVDLALPTTFSPQAGPSHASSPEADIDVTQLRTFSSQAGPPPANVVEPLVFVPDEEFIQVDLAEHVQHAVTVYAWKDVGAVTYFLMWHSNHDIHITSE